MEAIRLVAAFGLGCFVCYNIVERKLSTEFEERLARETRVLRRIEAHALRVRTKMGTDRKRETETPEEVNYEEEILALERMELHALASRIKLEAEKRLSTLNEAAVDDEHHEETSDEYYYEGVRARERLESNAKSSQVKLEAEKRISTLNEAAVDDGSHEVDDIDDEYYEENDTDDVDEYTFPKKIGEDELFTNEYDHECEQLNYYPSSKTLCYLSGQTVSADSTIGVENFLALARTNEPRAYYRNFDSACDYVVYIKSTTYEDDYTDVRTIILPRD
jgi:hypothetical protein